jgi:hydroxymethylbilane synthase
MASQRIRIGTRGSALALAQATEVKARLLFAHRDLWDGDVTLATIRTTGDRIKDKPLAEFGGKGLFTKEIEEALAAGEVDLAVHSMKDMPTVLPDGLAIAAYLEREDPRDAFLSPAAADIAGLRHGATVGSSSLRRQAQLRRCRPDLNIVNFRGNVDTRLRKLAAGEVDATLLACAGLRRLGLGDRIVAPIPPEDMLPAVAQGAIGLEIRADDSRMATLLAPLAHAETAICVIAERAFLAGLDGSCRTPIAALATLGPDGGLWLRGQILTPDGACSHETERRGAAVDAEAIGADAAAELRARGGPDFFAG